MIPSSMQAIHIKNKQINLKKTPLPEPKSDQVLVKVLLAGICRTDLNLLDGYYSFSGIPGHEFVGRVVQSRNYPHLNNQRIVSDINIGCGNCHFCKQNKQRHCPYRKALGIFDWPGAFAEYVCLPAANLHALDPEIPDNEAVFAEPLAAALRISQQVHILNQTRVAVLGDGKLGLLTAMALDHFSSKVYLLGRHTQKLNLAAQNGIKTYKVTTDCNFKELTRELGWFDLVVESTGTPQGIDHACKIVRPEGTVVLKTTSAQKTEFQASEITVNELNIVGSRCGDISQALYFLQKKWLDPLPLIEAIYPLNQYQQAFAKARQKGSKKVLLKISQ